MFTACCSTVSPSSEQGQSPVRMVEGRSKQDGERALREAILTPSFWSCCSEKRPVHFGGAARGIVEDVSMDAVIEAFLKGARPQFGATTSYRLGEPYMRESVFMAYLDHASLSLTGAELFLPWLLSLCQAFEGTFGFVTSKVLIDPPDSNGPPLLVESDSLMLQLLGEQRILVAPPLQGLPVSAPRPKPLLEATILPGDALYVPRGLECRQVGTESRLPKVYVLLSLRSPELSLGISLCKYLGDMLMDKQKVSADADAFFRSSLTRRTRKDVEKDSSMLDTSLQKYSRELMNKVSSADLRAHMHSRIKLMREEQVENAKEVACASPRPPVVLSSSILRLAPGVQCRCPPGGTSAHFTRGSDSMTMNIAPTVSALLDRLSDGQPHTVESLPCDDPVERICVCNIFLLKK